MATTVTDTTGRNASASPVEAEAASAKTGELSAESRITSHRLLESPAGGKRALEILHHDIFDSDEAVVLSALEALGCLRDPRSLPFVVRLLSRSEDAVVCAAAHAFTRIGHPSTVKVLSHLSNVTKSERVRSALLEALAGLSPHDPALVARLKEQVSSQLVSTEARASAAGALVKALGVAACAQLLAENRPEVVETMYGLACVRKDLVDIVLQHGASYYQRLPAASRTKLIAVAAGSTIRLAAEVLVEGLRDVDPEVRSQAYQALGREDSQLQHLPALVAELSQRADPVFSLEEAAQAAIGRLDLLASRDLARRVEAPQVFSQIHESFKSLSASERQLSSDKHELGWLISRSREYVEYYVDEEFRHSLLSYLKGGSYYSDKQMLAMLKATAVKLEVRHFDGYKALVEVIERPKRPGIALLSRELAVARMGKRAEMYRLIRNLRLSRMAFGGSAGDRDLVLRIYQWSAEAKLYRLAEAAMFALARMDLKDATEACIESLAPPVRSKICAIAAIRLLRELEWSALEPSVCKLLMVGDDPYVIVNLLEAVASLPRLLSGEAAGAVVTLLYRGEEHLARRAAEALGVQEAAGIIDSLVNGFDSLDPFRQSLALGVIERRVMDGGISNREGLVEFLYRLLRSDLRAIHAPAAVLLWKLGDDYALKALADLLRDAHDEEKRRIVQKLRGAVRPQILPLLAPLLREPGADLQDALRTTLASATGREAEKALGELALALRAEPGAEEPPAEEPQQELHVDFENEKRAYRFEREHVQELAILFTDIEGYTRIAQNLGSMQVAGLIQEYESILLPTIASHNGEVIKRMGDGHLFVFQSPLNAVLAAVRLQKALKRFNGYREEVSRLTVRAGIHWGKVVRKDGDVLGNDVNIGSRLERSAKGGSILVSEAIYDRLDGKVHCREIGLINVKGISAPIKVFEPYEIVIDLPADLDPLKGRQSVLRVGQAGGHEGAPSGQEGSPSGHEGASEAPTANQPSPLNKETSRLIAEAFAALNRICRRAEAGEASAADIRQELARRWKALRDQLGLPGNGA